DASVYGQRLPMIPVNPLHRVRQPERVEAAYFDPRLAQRLPEAGRRLPERTEPVVEDANPHALARLRHESIGERAPRIIIPDDVALDVHVPSGGRDRVQPRRVVLVGVDEQPHVVTGDVLRARRTRERLVEERLAVLSRAAILTPDG